jgi:hypothetical protein
MRFIDAYSSYFLPPGSATTQSFGMNPSSFGFSKGLRNYSSSTTLVVDTVGASLLGTSTTQVTLTQPFVNTFPFLHGSGNIHVLLFTHTHTPSALVGHPISHMVGCQVVHTNIVTQPTQPPSQPSQMSTPYIGGQYSMGGQPLSGGESSVEGNFFTGEKPQWFQCQ